MANQTGLLHPIVWFIAAAAVSGGVILHELLWLRYIERDDEEIRRLISNGLEIEVDRIDVSDEVKNELFTAADDEEFELEKQYKLRGSGRVFAGYLAYYVPFFVLGLAGWISRHWPNTNSKAQQLGARLRSFFARGVAPLKFNHSWFNGVSIIEFLILVFVFLGPKIIYLAYFIEKSQKKLDDGDVKSVHAIEKGEWSLDQFWLERISLWFGVDFLLQAPFLFAFAARGSLINTYMGISYGTSIKWHRWVGTWSIVMLFFHGLLYQALWLTVSGKMWVQETFRFEFAHDASNLAGAISWLSAIVMGVLLLPYVRRKFYWVFYRSHIIGAIIFTVFGVVHLSNVWEYLSAGLLVYGIDVAYRWLQTSTDVEVSLSAGGNLVNIIVPLQEGETYQDGAHVWLHLPRIGFMDYHPFCVASSPLMPGWESTLLLQCKAYDKWTDKLLKAVTAGECTGPVTAKIQGPFDGHSMPPVAADDVRDLLVVSGGVGLPAVLAALLRLALHRETNPSSGKITVFHTARTTDELILIAPLLQFPNAFDLHLHYTGKQDLLCSVTVPQPRPLLSLSCGGSIGKNDPKKVASDPEKGLTFSNDSLGQMLKLTPMERKWESLFVWIMCFFFGWWLLNIGDFWYNRSLKAQADVQSKEVESERTYTMGGWFLLALMLTVPVLPMLFIMLWRLAALAVRLISASRQNSSDDSATGAPVATGKITPTHVEVEVVSSGKANVSIPGGTSSVAVHFGRPNISAAITAVYEKMATGDSLTVWSAGPKKMNEIVYVAANALPLKANIRVYPMAYEL